MTVATGLLFVAVGKAHSSIGLGRTGNWSPSFPHFPSSHSLLDEPTCSRSVETGTAMAPMERTAWYRRANSRRSSVAS